MNLQIIKERQSFPIIAGMQFGTTNYKMRKIGRRIVEFTYLIYPDGDKVLQGEKVIKKVFTY